MFKNPFFKRSGHHISTIYSKSYPNSEKLAENANSKAVRDIKLIDSSSDFIVISVNDDAIQEISEQLFSENSIVVHTSGSVSMDALKKHANHGVFYPLQTLSKDESTEFSSIPILIEANSNENTQKLELLAKSISENYKYIDSEKRKTTHLAAVMANNFTNHIFSLLKEFCQEENVDFSLLKPLISKTIENSPPLTGPAKRGDINTLNKHIEMLEHNSDLKDLYKSISNHILTHYGHQTKL